MNISVFNGSSDGDVYMVFKLTPRDITVAKANMYADIEHNSINSFILYDIMETNCVKSFIPLAVTSRKILPNIVRDIEQFEDENDPYVTMSFGTLYPSISMHTENNSCHMIFHLNAFATVDMVDGLMKRIEQLEERVINIRTRPRH